MIQIDLPRAKELLQQCVEERGADYVYTNPIGNRNPCLYVHGTEFANKFMGDSQCASNVEKIEKSEPTPGCIVGLALYKAGVSLENLDSDGTAYGLILRLVEKEIISVSDGAGKFFRLVQRKQDTGMPWGQALDNAIDEFNYAYGCSA